MEKNANLVVMWVYKDRSRLLTPIREIVVPSLRPSPPPINRVKLIFPLQIIYQHNNIYFETTITGIERLKRRSAQKNNEI